MDLVRSWLGQALRATGAAVVVPVAILAALSLSALGGGSGIGGLGALSQVVAGPSAAGSDTVAGGGEAQIGDALSQLAAADADEVTVAPTGPGGAAPIGGPSPGSPDGGGPGPPGAVPEPGPDGGVPPPGGTGPTPPPGGGGGDDEPPQPEPPGVVEGVGENVKDITAETPLAPTLEDAVDTLVEVCGQLRCP